ncbi:MAG: polysaccharide biosynthesis tyrosine autokinase [Candidatus Aegiribacteria sp.]|nr:polysaccharide biosynthesis tyrosine autokinase [Candidatus Aegiribacteria sp.]
MNDDIFQEERESINISEYLWLLYHNKWIVLGFLIASITASIWMTSRIKPVFRSSATFIFNVSSNMTQALNISNVLWFEMDPMRNNQIQLIHSRNMAESVADSILKSPNSDSLLAILYYDLEVPQSNLRGSLIGMIRGSISISIMKDTDFFVLSATGYSPWAAATMTNLVVQTYYRKNLADTRGENTLVKEFLAEQLDIMETVLSESEDSLTMFKEEHGIVSLSTETAQIVRNLSTFETAAATSRTEQGALQAQKTYYSDQLETGRAGLAEDIANLNTAFIAQLESDIATLESSRASLMSRGGTEDDDVIKDLDRQISVRREALTQALGEAAYSQYPQNPAQSLQGIVSQLVTVESQLRAERIRESVLRSIIREIEDNISVLPELELRLLRLERNWRVSEDIYLLLRTRWEEVRIAEAGQIGNVTIVDTALPGSMIKPNKRRNLILGIFAGLAAGIGFIFLKEQLDSSIKNPEDIENLGIPVIGVIPKVPRSDVNIPGGKQGLIMVTAPRQAASEAYRDLRTSLRFSAIEEGVHSILVTSAGPGEGKSTTAGNLAVAIAQAGLRVLIVDTDLRRPVMHKMFGFKQEPGFSETVTGMIPLEEAVNSTGIENLSVLTSGHMPHNPSELLGSGKFRNLHALLKKNYDMIIFDSPPIAVVTDPVVMSPEVDATLMVVGVKKIDRRVLKSAWEKLQRGAGHSVGAVLNGFDPLNTYTSYSYYTYKYHYYYHDKKK